MEDQDDSSQQLLEDFCQLNSLDEEQLQSSRQEVSASVPHPPQPTAQEEGDHQAQEDRKRSRANDKWMKTFSIQGFQAADIRVQVDGIQYTLQITAKRPNPTRLQGAPRQASNKLKRVLPLPRNIDLQRLRVQMETEAEELVVRAPFVGGENNATSVGKCQPQRKTDSLACITIPVMWKNVASRKSTKKDCFSPCSGQGNTSTRTGSTRNNVNKCQPHNLKPSQSCSPNNLETEVVQDEVTGKWKLLLSFNAIGFRQEEVRVTFEEKERVLVVEMERDASPKGSEHPPETADASSQNRQHHPLMIALKHAREEIILPQWLDGSQLHYHVMENDALRIEIPCLREPTWHKIKQAS
jgi:hypothetical protein